MHARIQIYWRTSSIFRHLKLELLTQFPASNDEKYINVVYIWRKFVSFYGYVHWRMTTEISVMYGSEKVNTTTSSNYTAFSRPWRMQRDIVGAYPFYIPYPCAWTCMHLYSKMHFVFIPKGACTYIRTKKIFEENGMHYIRTIVSHTWNIHCRPFNEPSDFPIWNALLFPRHQKWELHCNNRRCTNDGWMFGQNWGSLSRLWRLLYFCC